MMVLQGYSRLSCRTASRSSSTACSAAASLTATTEEMDIEHRCQADDLWTGFEILEGRAFGHNQTLVRPLPCLKRGFF